jgi:hypothetical protein
MKHDLYTLFKHDLNLEKDQTELLAKIFDAVDKKQVYEIKKQKILWSVTSVLLFTLTIITGWHAASAIASSNIGNYISIIFSDTSQAFILWKEITISIVESLPIIGIGLFLASFYFLFLSAKKYSVRSHTLAY